MSHNPKMLQLRVPFVSSDHLGKLYMMGNFSVFSHVFPLRFLRSQSSLCSRKCPPGTYKVFLIVISFLSSVSYSYIYSTIIFALSLHSPPPLPFSIIFLFFHWLCLSASLPHTLSLPSVWCTDRKSQYVFTFCWDVHMCAHVRYTQTHTHNKKYQGQTWCSS